RAGPGTGGRRGGAPRSWPTPLFRPPSRYPQAPRLPPIHAPERTAAPRRGGRRPDPLILTGNFTATQDARRGKEQKTLPTVTRPGLRIRSRRRPPPRSRPPPPPRPGRPARPRRRALGTPARPPRPRRPARRAFRPAGR